MDGTAPLDGSLDGWQFSPSRQPSRSAHFGGRVWTVWTVQKCNRPENRPGRPGKRPGAPILVDGSGRSGRFKSATIQRTVQAFSCLFAAGYGMVWTVWTVLFPIHPTILIKGTRGVLRRGYCCGMEYL